MNEAALVAGTDPELDYYVARSNKRDTPWDKPMLRDRVLRQAVDLLAVTSFLPNEEEEEDQEPVEEKEAVEKEAVKKEKAEEEKKPTSEEAEGE